MAEVFLRGTARSESRTPARARAAMATLNVLHVSPRRDRLHMNHLGERNGCCQEPC